jgi:glycosyltransferase involved in cell wall biosynthesis
MRILFVHNALRSFVEVDRDILSEEHDVDDLDLSAPARIVYLPRRLARADLVFAWFASMHSLLPVIGARVLGKSTVVVVGGYDTANLPDIGYGNMAHPLKRYVVRMICGTAEGLVANSRSASDEVQRNVGRSAHVIYHGFPESLSPVSHVRDRLVVTVGNVSRESLRRKGHEVFVRSAGLVPDAEYVLAGQCTKQAEAYLREIAPSNVRITGFLPPHALDALLHRASVYVQASTHEGFGCAVAEAMAAGCVPVVSRRGALPEIVGDHGLWVDETDVASVADGVRRGLASNGKHRQTVADHVTRNFSIQARRRALLALVASVHDRPPDSDVASVAREEALHR